MKLCVVSASTDLERAWPCIKSWGDVETILVLNGDHAVDSPRIQSSRHTILLRQEYLGTVPAFKAGVDYTLEHTDADIIACLHDDLIIQDPLWGDKVIRRFTQHPEIGLLGFGGAIGLGDADLYQKPYQPQQLARIGFRSNLQDAEVHGIRSLLAERVAVLDGFSQVGRRAFWEGHSLNTRIAHPEPFRPWHVLADLGIVHHFQDGALACVAARYNWAVWYEPIRCQHLGGQTAVGDEGYQRWAQQQVEGGDHGFWQHAHKTAYAAFKDVLPLRI